MVSALTEAVRRGPPVRCLIRPLITLPPTYDKHLHHKHLLSKDYGVDITYKKGSNGGLEM